MAKLTGDICRAVARVEHAHFWRGKLQAQHSDCNGYEDYIAKEWIAASNFLERAIERELDAAAGKNLNYKLLKKVKIENCAELTDKTKRILKGYGFKTLYDLDKVSDKTLLKKENIGPVAVQEIRNAMEKHAREV